LPRVNFQSGLQIMAANRIFPNGTDSPFIKWLRFEIGKASATKNIGIGRILLKPIDPQTRRPTPTMPPHISSKRWQAA
jgi:hypothetical protein